MLLTVKLDVSFSCFRLQSINSAAHSTTTTELLMVSSDHKLDVAHGAKNRRLISGMENLEMNAALFVHVPFLALHYSIPTKNGTISPPNNSFPVLQTVVVCKLVSRLATVARIDMLILKMQIIKVTVQLSTL